MHTALFNTGWPLALVLALLAGPATAAPADEVALIERHALAEAQAPVRERADWRALRKIVVADMEPGRLDWLRQGLPADVHIVGARNAAEALEQVTDADALIGFCSEELLERGVDLVWVQVLVAGVEGCVDLPAMQARQPLLTNMQRVTGPVIAEHVMALTLALARALPDYQRAQDAERWDREAPAPRGPMSLEGRRLLVVGLGGIGIEVARRAHAFGMEVHAVRASRPEGPEFVARVVLPEGLAAELAEADVVVNALPLTPETEGQFDRAMFEAMPAHALFINVGRGGTVVTADLVAALEEGLIGGAGIDVTEPSPLPSGHPLWRAPNTLITPHVAARSELGFAVRWEVVRANLRRYLEGEPMLSVVDLERGY